MNQYDEVIGLWALHQVAPNQDFNSALNSLLNVANSLQLCSLHAFFYQKNDPAQQTVLAVIHNQMRGLSAQIIADEAGSRWSLGTPIMAMKVLQKTIAARLFLLFRYSQHLSRHFTAGDPSYTDSLVRVIGSIIPRMSWKKYKIYVEFLRDNDPLFKPTLQIMQFYSDQNKYTENLAYSHWIGEYYPDLFDGALDRMMKCQEYFQHPKHRRNHESINYQSVRDSTRSHLSLFIEPWHPDGPVEVITAINERFFHLALKAITQYALSLAGFNFRQISCIDHTDKIHTWVHSILLRPQYQPISPNPPIGVLVGDSKRVLYMLRQCTLEEHIRLAGKIKIVGDAWEKYERLAWLNYTTDPHWVQPITSATLSNCLVFLNCYLTWLHQVRELTMAKNCWMGMRSIPLAFEPKSLIFDFLMGSDIPLFLSNANYKLGKTLDYYSSYRKENSTFNKNFIEWLAPQRDLASHNRFTLFAGRPYSRAGEQELWVTKEALLHKSN